MGRMAKIMEDAMTTEQAKEFPRFIDSLGKWNFSELRAARTPEDGEEVCCAITAKPLFYIRKDGLKIPLDTYGICFNCDRMIHESQLSMPDVQKPGYPVVYLGVWCTECYALPMSKWRIKTKIEDVRPQEINE